MRFRVRDTLQRVPPGMLAHLVIDHVLISKDAPARVEGTLEGRPQTGVELSDHGGLVVGVCLAALCALPQAAT